MKSRNIYGTDKSQSAARTGGIATPVLSVIFIVRLGPQGFVYDLKPAGKPPDSRPHQIAD